MRRVNRFDELPNKIKYVVGGGLGLTSKNLDTVRKRFGQIHVYECKTKSEVYEVMKRENLEPMTLLDKDPLQGKFFFVALGLPDRRASEDLILFNPVERNNTVLYFAPLTISEAKEVLDDETKAREYYHNKVEKRKKNEHKKNR